MMIHRIDLISCNFFASQLSINIGGEIMSDPLEAIYNKYKKEIYYYVYKLTLNHHVAEELTQDTFLKAFRAFRKFRKEASIKTWLYIIARNTYLNYYDKNKNHAENTEAFQKEIMDPSNDFKSMDERMLIHNILLQLPEKLRSLLILRDYRELTYKEISRILDITEGQVKIGLHRARKKFKEIYKCLEEG